MKIDTQIPAQNKWGPFPFEDGKRILDIRYDAVFKAVFTKETAESRTALSRLISALIGRTVTVDTIIANEPAVDDVRQRYLRFDVACKTEKDEPINVEMSFNPDASELVRLEYHGLVIIKSTHASCVTSCLPIQYPSTIVLVWAVVPNI